MIGTYNYVLFTNDTDFLQLNWAKYQLAMNYVYGKVGPSGLLNVTGTRDWARWQQGFNNSEAQMMQVTYYTPYRCCRDITNSIIVYTIP